jgi:DNA-binding transcriptional MerR regulator
MSDDDLTIDELAQRTGMTVRNVRAHQSRGLLPPPRLQGRTGIYGADHVARLDMIRDLQAEGFNLEGIRRLIENAGESSTDLLRFTQELRRSFEEEVGREIPISELTERFGSDDPKLLERAIKLGVVRPLGDGWVEEVSPTLGRAAAELRALGVPPETALDIVAKLRRATDGAAKAFVELFLEQVWEPFDAAGRPADRWPAVQEGLDRLRPLADEAVLAVFRIVMDERVEQAVGEVLNKPTRK